VEELVVFDPDHALSPTRFLFQVFRKSKRGLTCVEATNADRVKSKSLGCYLRAVGAGDDLRVRLGTGFRGETLFPTDAEARAQEQALREQAEAAAHEERTRRERAEAAAQQAEAGQHDAEATTRDLEAQLEQVKAELALLRTKPKPSGPKRRTSPRK
jgi:multidrug resistance efflux pump